VHAELNAINFAVRHGIDIAGAHMFITDSPCIKCAEEITSRGLARVYFDRPYRVASGVEYLWRNGVIVVQILANGSINHRVF
jgi:dCMP deaminase